MPSSLAASFCRNRLRRSASSTNSRSSSRSDIPPAAGPAASPPRAPVASRRQREIRGFDPGPSASSTPRSSVLCSSRTLPGQAWLRIRASASSLKPRTGRPVSRAKQRRKWWASASRSSGRSRSGGRWMRITFRRKKRSSRNEPSRIRAARSWFVADTRRASVRSTRVPPRRWNSWSCSTRRSFAWIAGDMSPTSSRKSVPPLACSKRPMRWRSAPVKAPRSCPNSSDSSSVSGSAAQFTLTSGPSARGESGGSGSRSAPCRCRFRR